MHQNIKAVFFDLDGTLIDTAADLALALNLQLEKHNKPQLEFAKIRPHVSHGVAALLNIGFDMQPDSDSFAEYRQEYLDIYQQNLAKESRLFAGLDNLLSFLKQHQIPWGVITNKPYFLAKPLLDGLDLSKDCVSLIGGDTVKPCKPSPKPLFVACKDAGVLPVESIYIGDDLRDISAAKSAGMYAIAAGYGYIQPNDDIEKWQADIICEQSTDLLPLVSKLLKSS